MIPRPGEHKASKIIHESKRSYAVLYPQITKQEEKKYIPDDRLVRIISIPEYPHIAQKFKDSVVSAGSVDKGKFNAALDELVDVIYKRHSRDSKHPSSADAIKEEKAFYKSWLKYEVFYKERSLVIETNAVVWSSLQHRTGKETKPVGLKSPARAHAEDKFELVFDDRKGALRCFDRRHYKIMSTEELVEACEKDPEYKNNLENNPRGDYDYEESISSTPVFTSGRGRTQVVMTAGITTDDLNVKNAVFFDGHAGRVLNEIHLGGTADALSSRAREISDVIELGIMSKKRDDLRIMFSTLATLDLASLSKQLQEKLDKAQKQSDTLSNVNQILYKEGIQRLEKLRALIDKKYDDSDDVNYIIQEARKAKDHFKQCIASFIDTSIFNLSVDNRYFTTPPNPLISKHLAWTEAAINSYLRTHERDTVSYREAQRVSDILAHLRPPARPNREAYNEAIKKVHAIRDRNANSVFSDYDAELARALEPSDPLRPIEDVPAAKIDTPTLVKDDANGEYFYTENKDFSQPIAGIDDKSGDLTDAEIAAWSKAYQHDDEFRWSLPRPLEVSYHALFEKEKKQLQLRHKESTDLSKERPPRHCYAIHYNIMSKEEKTKQELKLNVEIRPIKVKVGDRYQIKTLVQSKIETDPQTKQDLKKREFIDNFYPVVDVRNILTLIRENLSPIFEANSIFVIKQLSALLEQVNREILRYINADKLSGDVFRNILTESFIAAGADQRDYEKMNTVYARVGNHAALLQEHGANFTAILTALTSITEKKLTAALPLQAEKQKSAESQTSLFVPYCADLKSDALANLLNETSSKHAEPVFTAMKNLITVLSKYHCCDSSIHALTVDVDTLEKSSKQNDDMTASVMLDLFRWDPSRAIREIINQTDAATLATLDEELYQASQQLEEARKSAYHCLTREFSYINVYPWNNQYQQYIDQYPEFAYLCRALYIYQNDHAIWSSERRLQTMTEINQWFSCHIKPSALPDDLKTPLERMIHSELRSVGEMHRRLPVSHDTTQFRGRESYIEADNAIAPPPPKPLPRTRVEQAIGFGVTTFATAAVATAVSKGIVGAVLTGLASGAVLGSVVPIIGTVIGAVIGAIAFGYLAHRANKRNAAVEAANRTRMEQAKRNQLLLGFDTYRNPVSVRPSSTARFNNQLTTAAAPVNDQKHLGKKEESTAAATAAAPAGVSAVHTALPTGQLDVHATFFDPPRNNGISAASPATPDAAPAAKKSAPTPGGSKDADG